MKNIVTLLAISLAMALVVTASEGKNKNAKDEPGKTKKTPDFTLKNYDGSTVRLSDYKGKIVVLEWLNYDCPFARYVHEHKPTMADLAEKYRKKGVVWLAVNSTNYATKKQNKAFAEEHKIDYPILDDHSGRTGRAYGAKTTPHMFIIDAKRNIEYNGAIDNAPLGRKPDGKDVVNYVDRALAELLAGKKVTIKKTAPYGCTVKYTK